MTEIISFEKALLEAGENKKHLLLGNGFSRACRNDIFEYGQLFDRADFGSLSRSARDAFTALDTTDFEIVMEALKRAAKLVSLYAPDISGLSRMLEADANGLREVLISAIAGSHPERPINISNDSYQHCKHFLSHFNDIYTVNYDLLLYWALMHEEISPVIDCDDGFRQPEDGPQDWVCWESSAHGQNIYYLHGALHIFEAGPHIQKFTWSNTQVALIDQIRSALEDGKYPLFVAEGSSSQKMTRIIRSSFLGRAYRSLENIGGSVFIYGLSMGESDAHILRAISHRQIKQLYVSVYGNPDGDSNRQIIERAEFLAKNQFTRRKSLEVRYFDASSAKVWG